MNKVVSFSGGRTSAYLCKVMLDKYPREQLEFVFMDTGAEHPKTYEFIRKVNDHFNLNLTCLRTKYNPELGKANSYEIIDINDLKWDLSVSWEGMLSKYSTPYSNGGSFCTDRMKLVPWTKYLNEKYGKGNYYTFLGIRADEPRRLKEKDGIKYLVELDDSDKQDILDYWSSMPFDLGIHEHLGNCVFCIKKNPNKVALAIKDEPLLYEDFLRLLESDVVRKEVPRKSPVSEMYRGRLSLRQIHDTYKDIPRKQITERMRGYKDEGMCSESCEVFSDSRIPMPPTPPRG